MNSKELNIKLKSSKIPLVGLSGLWLILIPSLYYIHNNTIRLYIWLVLALAALIWLYRYLIFRPLILVVDTKDLTVQIDNRIYNIRKIRFLSWWCSLLIIQHPRRYITIFVDSTKLTNYKKLRMLRILL